MPTEPSKYPGEVRFTNDPVNELRMGKTKEDSGQIIMLSDGLTSLCKEQLSTIEQLQSLVERLLGPEVFPPDAKDLKEKVHGAGSVGECFTQLAYVGNNNHRLAVLIDILNSTL